jgi:amino acid transporter
MICKNVHTKALTVSTIIAFVFVVVSTIWSELSKPFKDFLVSITGHHWVTKGVFSLALFVLVYFLAAKTSSDSEDVEKQTNYVIFGTIIGSLIIFLFYVWHFFS